jgi:uncharacterized protein YktB (UPF0637 family)
MATLGFLRRDFDVFAIEDFNIRLAKIDEFVTPRLLRLAPEFSRELSRSLQVDLFPHIARHMRRAANPPAETSVAFGPSRAGYKRFGHLALCVSGVGIHARVIVKSDADKRSEMAQLIKSKSTELQKAFRGTKIQQYQNWNCREMPRSSAANAEFFDGLADALENKSGALDAGFGWPVRDALTVDRAEVLDAFRELEPLYSLITSVAS